MFLCVRCGGRVFVKRIEDVLLVDGNAAVVHMEAGVCENDRCGEGYFSMAQSDALDSLRDKIRRGDMDGFKPLGNLYEIELPESAWRKAPPAAAKIGV